ncbi:PREDICTED: peroxisomal nicotinamide adenine dinucleotide carrier-like [Ipomoea nil]|uniref:peroxisomal nicotinamide adenine dinucleotide carrier-like n=1 Tax=Ipomoea nil TaxID=35883 RepID=UPI0009008B27|nr:PREDICTED: peroxisomal nicotinamide adenine dinucleotide carrier-like [Ipomoea nil]
MSKSNAVVNGLAGAGGGIIAQIITYPLQTVNTRQQTERVAKRDSGSHQSRGGTLFQILQAIQNEGLGGLYSGLMPSLLGTAASQGVYYYCYQVFKNKAVAIAAANKKKGSGDGSVGMLSWLVVAALAGSLNVLLTIPIWVLVTRMQTHTQAERKIVEAKRETLLKEASENDLLRSSLPEKLAELDSLKPHPYGTFHAAQEVYNESGIIGFWKGVIPALIMVSNPSIQFMIYETSLKHLKTKRNKHNTETVSALEVFLLGALAKLGATISTYPLLVVKSRLQAKQEIGGNTSLRYSGTLDAIIKMIRYEGLKSFYQGMSTKIVQSVFAASVLFMVKEELVKAHTVLANKAGKLRQIR